MERAKETTQILQILKDDYGWIIADENKEHLVSYTIHAVKKLLINTPQTGLFGDNVASEMAHHVERWGDESHKSPHEFQMVISYLNGKLMKAIWEKDAKAFEHHLTTIAAVAGTAHKYLTSESRTSEFFIKQPITHQ